VTVRRIIARAPVRVADLGGWSDTWFAGHGAVCHVAVNPGARVSLAAWPAAAPLVQFDVASTGERYGFDPARPPGRHPLLEATLREIPLPAGVAARITCAADVPPGCSTGTSAAVCVALLAALDRLAGGARGAAGLARAAHRVETLHLGWQSGVQDQLAAAFGGINLVQMPAYPTAHVTPLPVAAAVRATLERTLLTVFLGRSHHSSAVHEQVIARLRAHDGAPALDPLRQAASAGAAALCAGDLTAFGAWMVTNTEAQRALHPTLVSADADALIALARQYRALGWKVNGAGGDGGSLSILCADAAHHARLARAIEAAGDRWRVLPFRLAAAGVRARDVP
jgi:D-glycero-alpha-D-manno-heptose-7-phosphate kinase